MLALLSHLWMDSILRTWEGLRRGPSEPFLLHADPPPAIPYEVVYAAFHP